MSEHVDDKEQISKTNRIPCQQEKNCEKCGEPLRVVKVRGQVTDQAICVNCKPPNGTCPLCGGALNTQRAQRCPECKSSWHFCIDGRRAVSSVSGTVVAGFISGLLLAIALKLNRELESLNFYLPLLVWGILNVAFFSHLKPASRLVVYAITLIAAALAVDLILQDTEWT